MPQNRRPKFRVFITYYARHKSLCFLFVRFKGIVDELRSIHQQISIINVCLVIIQRLWLLFPWEEKTLAKQKQKLLKYQEEGRREKNPSALAFLGLQMCVAQAPRWFIPRKPKRSICFVDFTTPFVLLQTFQRAEMHYYLVKSLPKSFLQPEAVLTWVEHLTHKRIAFVPRSSHWLSRFCSEPIRNQLLGLAGYF